MFRDTLSVLTGTIFVSPCAVANGLFWGEADTAPRRSALWPIGRLSADPRPTSISWENLGAIIFTNLQLCCVLCQDSIHGAAG